MSDTVAALILQVYITGHGGDGFMKFQDKEEATSDEIGAAFALVSPCSQCVPTCRMVSS